MTRITIPAPEDGTDHVPDTWSPDGRHLLFDSVGKGQSYELWHLAVDRGKAEHFVPSVALQTVKVDVGRQCAGCKPRNSSRP